MMDSRRQLAATLGRIYPYRAAKQQAPGVAAAGAKGFPNRSGMTNMSGMTECKPGMTGDSRTVGNDGRRDRNEKQVTDGRSATCVQYSACRDYEKLS
ncbi:MAG: hypothetical protein VZR01_01230 [Candidatus Cryptobacteroides sp.]|nr:hypothetical protein [Candidatus Cryptobacteroides sp.]